MLVAASEQLSDARTLAGNMSAYALREALMSLLNIAGRPRRTTTDAARRVIDAYAKFRSGSGAADALDTAVTDLGAALDGPGPHDERLERVIRELARRSPARAEADLLERYIDVLDNANRGAHTKISVQVAGGLYEQALIVVERLFGPIIDRFDEIEALRQKPEPTAADVETLAGHIGDPRALAYFFSELSGPGWLHALSESPLLLPLREGVWATWPYLSGLAQSHPAEIRAWLSSLANGSELGDQQAAQLLAVARIVKTGIGDVVVKIAEGRLGDVTVLHHVSSYLDEIGVEEHGEPAVRELLKRALSVVLDADRRSADSYLAAGMLRVAISAAQQDDAARWLRILTAKLKGAVDAVADYRSRQILDVGELKVETGSATLELMTAAVLDVARVAREHGLSTDDRLQLLRRVPEPLQGRIIASHLIETLDADLRTAVDFVKEEVGGQVPMPETLALLRALRDRNANGLAVGMGEVLGDPPGAAELAATPTPPFPDSWRRAYGWIDALPETAAAPWKPTADHVAKSYGPASSHGHVIPRARAEWVAKQSPLTVEDLAASPPLDAADRIAAWRPDLQDVLGPRADGLNTTLEQALKNRPEPWLTADPIEVIKRLRHPTYIAGYFNANGDQAAEVPDPDRLIAAIDLVQSEPWEVEDLGGTSYDYEQSWMNAADKGIALLGKLIAAHGVGDRETVVWEILGRAVRARDGERPFDDDADVRPLDHAINRPSTRALEVVFSVAEIEAGDGPLPAKFLELLEEELALTGRDGLHARAIIATRLAWLVNRAQQWTADRWEVLVGDEAPDGLGPATFDVYLEWGSPSRAIFEKDRDRFVGALTRTPEHARQQILIAMTWGVDGYTPNEIARILAEASPSRVSEAGAWLATTAADVDDMPLEPAIAFWQAALNAQLPAEAYAGFGWFANVQRLQSETWLELTRRTAATAGGTLEQPRWVARRALGHADDPRSIDIVTHLLAAQLPLWHLTEVGEVGLAMLSQSDPTTAEARARLRERLLEREFFEAKRDGPT